MKVYSINPNSKEYFEDVSDHMCVSYTMYQGMYNYTPVFPRYTFSVSGRFNYTDHHPEIEFCSMLPVKRLFGNYLVEVRYRFILSAYNENSLNEAIIAFNRFCKDCQKTINISKIANNKPITA